jgi:hypothetical protein
VSHAPATKEHTTAAMTTAVLIVRRRRRALHDPRRRQRHPLQPRRAPDAAPRPRRAAAPPQPRGRARILEIISLAGFEQFFAELALLTAGDAPDPEAAGELCARYALDMQPESPPELCARFGLWFPGVTA